MEQKDYILREIEKIGMILRAIINRLTGSMDGTAIQIEKQFEETKEMLTIEMDFDLDKFMEQNESESKNYLSSFRGINLENIELLADLLMQMGLKSKGIQKKSYLHKSIQLFNYCKQMDKTYIHARESKIYQINKELSK
ncbi:MAG: hypothetical protein PHD06_05885 [Bacteroidales bacterium]|nr:hypothetical protein [Bacteroidales bacterium]